MSINVFVRGASKPAKYQDREKERANTKRMEVRTRKLKGAL